jgi:hypothetical protein
MGNSLEEIYAAIWAAYDRDSETQFTLRQLINRIPSHLSETDLCCALGLLIADDLIDLAADEYAETLYVRKENPEDTDTDIDTALASISDLWDEPPSKTWVNQAEVETDADTILAAVAKMPSGNAGICTHSQLLAATKLSQLRLDRAISFLVAKSRAASIKRDVWVFRFELPISGFAQSNCKFDILLDDRLISIYTILAPELSPAQRTVAIECLNRISKLRGHDGGAHFVP